MGESFLLKNTTNFDSLTDFVVNIVNLLISFSVVLAVGALIIAGFKYILAIGDQEKVEKATKSLVFAIVGLVIVFVAPLVVEYITETLLVG
jgi:hypothetical protein